jgi:RecA/RadA recombinase
MGSFITESTALLVVDTVTSLYRSALGSTERVFAQNRELNRQLAYLAELASVRPVVILLTNQVHALPSREGYHMEPVAKRVLTYWSEVILRLTLTANPKIKKAQLERFPSANMSGASSLFRITDRGLEEDDGVALA